MKKTILFLLLAVAVACGSAQASDLDNPIAEDAAAIQEVHDFIKGCGKYFIATTEGDQPRVRPFGTVAIFEGRLYIQTGKKKNVARQILANPKIEICALSESGDRWLRVEATATPDERVEAKQYVLDQHPSLKSIYSATDENTLVLALSNVTATFYSFTDEARVVKF
jgi:uncharacterized pyridoxamine 5'-phosphate oxidase family protein